MGWIYFHPARVERGTNRSQDFKFDFLVKFQMLRPMLLKSKPKIGDLQFVPTVAGIGKFRFVAVRTRLRSSPGGAERFVLHTSNF